MLTALLPLIVFAADVTAPPATPAVPPVDGAEVVEDETGAPFLVAQALVDADQVVRVEQGPGIVVFDLDRADERFQMTVALDDDGRVTASTIDWVGAADGAFGFVPGAVRQLPIVERIDWDPARNALVLRGRGRSARVPLGGQT